MDARMLFGSLSIGLAFISAVLCALGVCSAIPHHRDAAVVRGVADAPRVGRLAWRLRNGFAVLNPFSAWFLKNVRVRYLVHEAVQLLGEHRYVSTNQSLLSCILAVCAVFAAAACMATQNVVGAFAVVGCALAVAVGYVRAASDKRCDAMRDAVPDVLRSMGTCFDAGFTLQQTLSQVASETQGSLHSVFAHAVHVLETGGSATEALASLRQGSEVLELAFVAMALDVQHQTGGSMRQVLDAARDSVEGELALRRTLKVQTAQAKLSAQVVSVMPFALVAVFSLVSDDFLSPFFASVSGWALLALALGMQAVGVGMVRHVLAVGAGS